MKNAGLRVLIVEDEALIAVMIEDMLEDLGHVVAGRAARVDEAEHMVKTVDADLAILDLNLNGERTFAVADALKLRGVPLIFSTGYVGDNFPQEWTGRPVLSKPFQIHDIEAAITRALTTGN